MARWRCGARWHRNAVRVYLRKLKLDANHRVRGTEKLIISLLEAALVGTMFAYFIGALLKGEEGVKFNPILSVEEHYYRELFESFRLNYINYDLFLVRQNSSSSPLSTLR